MNSPDEDWTARVREELDDDIAALDPRVSRRLARARATALSPVVARRRPFASFAPGLSFAAAAMAVVLLAGPQQTPSPTVGQEQILFELALVEDDIELIEDLDFYHWLDANGHAG